MIANPIILSEDEAETLMRALKVPQVWTPELIAEWQAMQAGATNAFEVIDAIRMELRRRRDVD